MERRGWISSSLDEDRAFLGGFCLQAAGLVHRRCCYRRRDVIHWLPRRDLWLESRARAFECAAFARIQDAGNKRRHVDARAIAPVSIATGLCWILFRFRHCVRIQRQGTDAGLRTVRWRGTVQRIPLWTRVPAEPRRCRRDRQVLGP